MQPAPAPVEQLQRSAFTLNEVADKLGITRWVVQRLIHEGRLRAVNVGGTHPRAVRWIVPKDALEDFLRQPFLAQPEGGDE